MLTRRLYNYEKFTQNCAQKKHLVRRCFIRCLFVASRRRRLLHNAESTPFLQSLETHHPFLVFPRNSASCYHEKCLRDVAWRSAEEIASLALLNGGGRSYSNSIGVLGPVQVRVAFNGWRQFATIAQLNVQRQGASILLDADISTGALKMRE